MTQEYMDKMVGFYAPTATVDRFNAICKECHINKSEFFRAKMIEFIAAHEG